MISGVAQRTERRRATWVPGNLFALWEKSASFLPCASVKSQGFPSPYRYGDVIEWVCPHKPRQVILLSKLSDRKKAIKFILKDETKEQRLPLRWCHTFTSLSETFPMGNEPNSKCKVRMECISSHIMDAAMLCCLYGSTKLAQLEASIWCFSGVGWEKMNIDTLMLRKQDCWQDFNAEPFKGPAWHFKEVFWHGMELKHLYLNEYLVHLHACANAHTHQFRGFVILPWHVASVGETECDMRKH